MIKKQIIVRTCPNGYTKTTGKLQELLDKGYIVKFITPINDGFVDYIVEKEVEND